MIVDASAVIAILNGEPEAADFTAALVDHSARMSVATWLEVSLVIDQRWPDRSCELDDLIRWGEVDLVPVDHTQARLARVAYRRFGRGSGSQARLNFGDCFSYALAAATGEPLLFKGDDFVHTDVLTV